MYDDDDDDGQEASFQAPHMGGIWTSEPNKAAIEIGIVLIFRNIGKVKLTCYHFYTCKNSSLQLYFSEIVICCENWPFNIRKLMYVQVDIVLGVKKASR